MPAGLHHDQRRRLATPAHHPAAYSKRDRKESDLIQETLEAYSI